MPPSEHADLGLTTEQIRTLANSFPSGSDRLWQDIRVLARLLVPANPVAWHHFLLAVGNFKRQTQVAHYLPKQECEPRPELPKSIRVFDSEGNDFELRSDDANSWRRLDDAHGIGVPTATTILAALWPDDHAILDRRVIRTSLALTGTAGNWATGRHGTKTPMATWPLYDWFIATAKRTTTADVSLGQVERALYRLDQAVPAVKGRMWDELAKDLRAKAAQQCADPSD